MGFLDKVIRKKPVLGFFAGDGNNFRFVDPIITSLSEDYKVKKILCDDGDIAQMTKELKKLDIAWFEWGNGPLITASNLGLNKPPIITRIHRYEAYTEAPKYTNWDYVDKVIFSADSTKKHFVETFVTETRKIKSIEIVRMGIDTDFFNLTRKKKGKNMAFVGRICHDKNIPLLLQFFYELLLKNPEYHLSLVGAFDNPVLEEFYYDQVNKLGLSNNVHYLGVKNQAELKRFLTEMDYIVSTSIIEGQSVAVLEAMSMGLKPILYNYSNSAECYPKKYLYNTLQEFIEMVTNEDFEPTEYRKFVLENNGFALQIDKIKKIINELLDEN